MRSFMNAQDMALRYPASFTAPTLDELRAVKAGDHVKVCTEKERFWLEVTGVDHRLQAISGVVDNELIRTHEHGFKYKDSLTVQWENIYSILSKEEGEALNKIFNIGRHTLKEPFLNE